VALHPTSHGKHVVLPVSAVTAEGADGDEVSGGSQPAEPTEREAEGLRRFGWSQQGDVVYHEIRQFARHTGDVPATGRTGPHLQ
jgi:hypothetical protein